jgi:ketosteroid isomerase-like protein
VVTSYLASFESRDIDVISGHVADGYVNEHASALGGESVGIDEYRRRLPGFLAMFLDLRYEIEHVVETGDRAMAAYRLFATHEGHAVDIRGVMSVVAVDGKIVSRVDYWDSYTFLVQTGQA